MIFADNITVQVSEGRDAITLLRDQTVLFPSMARVGVLAPPGSGRTTLSRVFGGITRPSSGHMLIEGSVGWPIGFSGFFNPLLSLAENIEHIATLKRASPSELASVISWMCGSDSLFDMTFGTLPPSDRATAVYAASLAVHNDHIIADEKIVLSDAAVAEKSNLLLSKRLEGAGLLFFSRNARLLGNWCETFYVLIDKQLHAVPDPAAGQAMLDRVQLAESAT